ncbi:MAG: helix-turn-helix domain-containing protein [Actinomycetota bacterium]|nr:helix-turn-helix domain-containing protein [Actinomycetota bacterium]
MSATVRRLMTPPEQSFEPLLLGVRDAAHELGIGRDSAYALVREGRLRHVSVNRRILIPRTELAAFVAREVGRETT